MDPPGAIFYAAELESGYAVTAEFLRRRAQRGRRVCLCCSSKNLPDGTGEYDLVLGDL